MVKKYNYAKPFRKILVNILLLLILGLALYYINGKNSNIKIVDLYEKIGSFICKYDVYLIGVILGVNILELIDFIIYSKRDEVINSNFEYLQGNIGILTFFKQYFAPLFTKGPYIFASEEKLSAPIRKLFNFLTGLVKFAYWLVIITLILSMNYQHELSNLLINGNRNYAYTMLILFLCINCNVFVYALYRITPLYEARTYKIITYYSDGSSKSRTESRSNFMAILILSIVIYLYFSLLYLFEFANKIIRIIETNKLLRFLNKCDSNQCLLRFYREK
mgnify:CR=1 FL=1